MSTVSPGRTPGRVAEPGPRLTTAPWGGRLIGFLFTLTVLLFLLWLVAL